MAGIDVNNLRGSGPPPWSAVAELVAGQWGVISRAQLHAAGVAAVLACGPAAVLSHLIAAAHWGLLATDQVRIDVTAPAVPARRPGDPPAPHSFPDAQDTTNHEGIPITSVSRTLLDLAESTRSDQLERALAQAMHLRVYDQRAIDDVIARSNGHRGTKILAQATAQEPSTGPDTT